MAARNKSDGAGSIAFSDFIQVQQFYPVNQTICLVNPNTTQYYAQVHITQNNFGKLKTGQEVLLKLSAYPFQEFGSLKGQLNFISTIPTDSGFIGKILLPAGLQTNQPTKAPAIPGRFKSQCRDHYLRSKIK